MKENKVLLRLVLPNGDGYFFLPSQMDTTEIYIGSTFHINRERYVIAEISATLLNNMQITRINEQDNSEINGFFDVQIDITPQ